MQIGLEQISALRLADAAALRKRKLISLALLIGLFCLMMCLRTTCIGFVSPLQVVENFILWIRLQAANLLHLPLYDQRYELIMSHPYYLETIGRLGGTLTVMALGAVLSVSGAVFQNVFRNPIATPTMLGVSSGVDMGNLVMILKYSTAAATMTVARYEYCYVFCVALLLLILLVGRLMGNKKSSVTDMLLAGSIIVRLLSNLLTSVQDYYFTEDEFLLFQELSLYGTGVSGGMAAVILAAALLVGLMPLGMMRFSMNAVSFEDSDVRCLGLRPGIMRLISLICSTILMTASMIHLGNVSMLSLLVPHVSRYVFGANFKELYFSCTVYGAMMMMLCRIITYLFSFNELLDVISMGTVVNLVATPVLVILLIRQRRGWE